MKTGKNPSVTRLNAKQRAYVQKILSTPMSRPRTKLTPEDIHARLIFFIGAVLAMTFFGITMGAVYALVFVTQPIGAQAPNDRDFIQLLQTLAIFLTGALGGVLAGNGLKSKADKDSKKDTPVEN
jgi:hypothetical protein